MYNKDNSDNSQIAERHQDSTTLGIMFTFLSFYGMAGFYRCDYYYQNYYQNTYNSTILKQN